jgi:allantoicase
VSTDFRTMPDLAARALGGSVMRADDELFATAEHLLLPGPPAHDPTAYGLRGKEYDGWETRRRRDGGEDTALVRLGVPGVVHGVVVDTSWFVGNYPPRVSVAATEQPGHPTPEELDGAPWTTLVDHAPVVGDTVNPFPVAPARWTHVRLTQHPDGGVARLRVHGRPSPDPALLTGTIDLAALENGGDVVACSDMFFADARNLLLPGSARHTGEGWETARRRGPGNDHVTIRLAGPSTVRRVVVDATGFVGNAPAAVSLRGIDERETDLAELERPDGGIALLPRTRLLPDTRHRLPLGAGPVVTHVRLDTYPDGGLARLRVLGELA